MQANSTWRLRICELPLRSILARLIPKDAMPRVEEELRAMGELAGGELYQLSLEDRLNEPTLTQWSPYGERIDRIEITKLWQRCAEIVPTDGRPRDGPR